MGPKRQIDQDVPPDPEASRLRVQFEDHIDKKWRQRRQNEKRMARSAVIGKILDGITERYQHVQVREKAANASPQHGSSTDLSTQRRFADGGAKGYLCDGIQLMKTSFSVPGSQFGVQAFDKELYSANFGRETALPVHN